ncbi:MAG: hypothetical protein KKF68_03335 [Nanoarchaeota archaeon]|nr:hypothetical protein [Nanoarchaeota archaeon]
MISEEIKRKFDLVQNSGQQGLERVANLLGYMNSWAGEIYFEHKMFQKGLRPCLAIVNYSLEELGGEVLTLDELKIVYSELERKKD